MESLRQQAARSLGVKRGKCKGATYFESARTLMRAGYHSNQQSQLRKVSYLKIPNLFFIYICIYAFMT
jgi:hypothetical protein